jgi:hypothetical protein
MLTHHIALVSQTSKIPSSELHIATAALQKQVTRDLGPVWEIQATVDAFDRIQDIPAGYWPIFIRDDIQAPGAEGYHTDRNRQPFALVRHSPSWMLTASHELCEMLVDPFGDRMVASGSIVKAQGRVNYIVEVCDPCESDRCAYSVNGVTLSDFYTPHYFDPVRNSAARYSYSGRITRPKQILKGGYLSWLDTASGKWYQASWFGAKPAVREITSKMEEQEGSFRARIDRITKDQGRHAVRKPAPGLTLENKRRAQGLQREKFWHAETQRAMTLNTFRTAG